MESRKFFVAFLAGCLAWAALIAAINAIVDPYSLFSAPRIEGFNKRKRAASHEQLIKAYDVLRARPHSLILGTSVADLGLDPLSDAWPGSARPVYNLALGGGGPYTSYRYLQHIMSQQHIGTIVLCLDYPFFLNIPEAGRPTDPNFESRLWVTADGRTNDEAKKEYLRTLLYAAGSYDALLDSVATVTANLNPDSGATFITSGYLDGEGPFRVGALIGFPIFELDDIGFFKRYAGRQRDPRVLQDLQAILDLCRARGTRAIVVINAVHAHMLEILATLGYWQDYEKWSEN
jgi:hypothetical protein